MARVKRAVGSKKHRKQVLERAKGYRGNKSRSVRAANEQVMKSGQYAFRDRRAKKGEFRRLWIQRINAACRLPENEISYSRFIAGLAAAGIEVDRKVMSDLAITDPAAFSALVHAREGCSLSTTGLTFSNPKVQRLRRLLGRRSARSEEGVFVVEGASLVTQALAAGWEIEAQFVAPGADEVPSSAPVFEFAPNVIERVASTEAPQPVLAVFRQRPSLLPAGADFVMVADRLGDPGNAGTIIRSAEAAGAQAVVFTPGSVDPYNPKVVRSTAGSLFRVPVLTLELNALRAAGLHVLATSSHRGDPYTETSLTGPVALVVGNEAHGVPDEAPVDGWVTIPHAGAAESLNVAMAATVLAFEVARQRRQR